MKQAIPVMIAILLLFLLIYITMHRDSWIADYSREAAPVSDDLINKLTTEGTGHDS
jgi:hypothetical protein